MTYSLLFFGLPVLGVALFLSLVRPMARQRVPGAPGLPLFCCFAGYGAVLLFFVSDYFRVWSAGHSLAAFALFFIALPLLLFLGISWRSTWRVSLFHRAMLVLCFAFPLAIASLFVFTR
jgi:hypothetical protein